MSLLASIASRVRPSFLRSAVDPRWLIVRTDIREQRGSNNKYNVAEQQEVYKKEIKRIWAAQAKALSDTRPVRLTDDDEQRANRGLTPSGQTPADSVSPGMFGEGTTPGGTAGNTKILKIRRKVRLASLCKNLIFVLTVHRWATRSSRSASRILESLRRTSVNDRSSRKRRKSLKICHSAPTKRRTSESVPRASSLRPFFPSSCAERLTHRLELAVANLKRNQARRLARKNAEQNGAPLPADDAGSPSGAAAPSLIGNKVKSSKPTSRVCGSASPSPPNG